MLIKIENCSPVLLLRAGGTKWVCPYYGGTAMHFIKAILVIFLTHLVLIGLMSVFVAMNYILDQGSEAHVLWILYGNIVSFPFQWLWTPVYHLLSPPISPFSNLHLNYFWNGAITPGYIYLIIGWTNWCIISMPFFLVWQMSLKLKYRSVRNWFDNLVCL